MGRPEEPLNRDGSPEREFAFWLRDLRNSAGLTYESLARATNYSTSTMQAAASGQRLPTYKVAMAFVEACEGSLEDWKAYWAQIKRALDTDPPPGTTWPVKPPWVDQPEMVAAQAAPSPAPPDVLDNGERPSQQASAAAPADAVGPAALMAAALPEYASVDSDGGWYVESFSALLRLDTAQPEAIEDRVIVATANDLRELHTSISVPRHRDDPSADHELDSELVFGGSLELSEHPSESYFRNVIALAEPLKSGQSHKYRLRIRVPPGQRMAPHYVYMPFQRTDYFELVVRFDPQRLPRRIWVLSEMPPVVLYEDGPGGDVLTPDRFGEIRVEFRNLRLGLGYGVRWQE